MAKQRNKMAEASELAIISTPYSNSRHAVNSYEIAALAYGLWQARGCPDGSPEIDWFQAEQELLEKVPAKMPEPGRRRSAAR